MGANFPGPSERSWGQASQVASGGCHSAGMRDPRWFGFNPAISIQPALQNWRVGIDTPVAQEGPIAAHFLHAVRIAFGDQNGFFSRGRFGNHLAEWVGDEG